ncbi:nitroreductase family protein [Acetobacterium wieringae]|uniref:nitroreductase family protein n=1 Tax=Acetobacterium wieringae TaxID=52694 RepID=UPI0020340A93|nr:nitroreductase family protein [Acetobacterium wieringae]URN84757.1 nitroreductase family protein [Acetobacterium wieringae]
MPLDFKEAIEGRRSIYEICNESTITAEEILEIVDHSTKHIPSAFNCQSQRVAVLFGEKHLEFWGIVMDILRKRILADEFRSTENRINGFAAGCGTLLFYDDTSVTKGLMEKFLPYRDSIPDWAEQANGMLQFAIWTQLEAAGLGASLQHYNPIIDKDVKDAFLIPSDWRLIAQMPFGVPTEMPVAKNFEPIERRVIVVE